MTNWPWRFVTLHEQAVLARRQVLDRYGAYGQVSVLLAVLVYLVCHLDIRVPSQSTKIGKGYAALPRKHVASSTSLRQLWRAFSWWLGGEARPGWGSRGHLIAGTAWLLWLLFLCIHHTTDDYLHLTKRFGIVACSQFPLHYVLSMKSRASPFAVVFGLSHEQLNPYHRMLGRIIYSLITLHAVFYLNFFVQAGLLTVRLCQLIPLLGVVAFSLLTILVITSLLTIRKWSYRVFFVTHLVLGLSIPPLLFFHARSIRSYMIEAVVIFFFDLGVRKYDTFLGFSRLLMIEHTNILKIEVPVPSSIINRFLEKPGQHVYLSLPPASTPIGTPPLSIYDFTFSPFTVASASSTHITLVLRTLHGPSTRALQRLGRLTKARPGINIEGPYGAARAFPDFAEEFDKVLLVAGGVGATFVLPIFTHIASSMKSKQDHQGQVEMIWSVKSVDEASWANFVEHPRLLNDSRLKVFVTRAATIQSPPTNEVSSANISVPAASSPASMPLPRFNIAGRTRPDLKVIVDSLFQEGREARVAVLVCGPAGMAREIRAQLDRWVLQGRDVWWHEESFGW